MSALHQRFGPRSNASLMLRRHLSATLAVIILVACGAAGAADVSVTTEYDLRYGPLTVLSVHATTTLSDAGYHTAVKAETVGVVALVFPWQAWGTTDGSRDGGQFSPRRHHSGGEYRGQRRTAEIDYRSGGAVVTALDPRPQDDYRDAVPVALLPDTVDPLTATLQILASQCRGVVRVFDGRRRYDIQLTDLGDAEVPSARRMIYTGRAHRCQGDIKPLAGFWRTDPGYDERPSRLGYWIATPKPDLPPMPVYVELSSHRGTLSMYLTAVDRAAGAGVDAP